MQAPSPSRSRGASSSQFPTREKEIEMRSVIVSLSMVFAIAALAPCAANARSVKRHLHPTGVDPDARGVAVASVHAKAHRGKFRVSARNLNPGATFGTSVAGVRIGSRTPNGAGP